ncbi:uncharacterized protein LOC131653126 isoform X1 [Vicia villosa]|uniref:uncharacterized protein LOC131653126 isoform X1 n=2 Tax=Vicia villosa TaxID=3911 RepID=UPI00273B483A|nr:uncharacterized protein LOC131653126 isoform X1 [Vicia villosa]
MASISPTCSPTSLQLRLAFNSSKFPLSHHARLRNINPRLPPLCSAYNDKRPESVASNPKAGDGFSGWSDSSNTEHSDHSPKNKDSFGGVVGVGVAGAVLFTGLTFLALSLGKRNRSGLEQQMKPLTTHQEVHLSSDDREDDITEPVNAEDKLVVEDGKTEGQIETSRESDNIQGDYKTVDDSDIGSEVLYDSKDTSNGINNDVNRISDQEELLHESARDNELIVPSENQVPLQTENTVDSFSDLDRNLAVDTTESTSDLKENQVNAEPGNIPNYDGKPPDLNNEQQGEITSSNESRNSDISEPSYGLGADNKTESAGIVVNPESNNTISSPKIFSEDDQDNIDLNKTQLVSHEGNKSSFEEKSIPENDLLSKSVFSQSTNSLVDDRIRNENNEVNKDISESPNSESLFSAPGIPAPSVVSAALQVVPGKVLVPAAFDQVQGQALAALQVLKVIEPDVQPGDLCTRREYARWLVSASGALSRNSVSKVYPAMYIDNVTELAFDDITTEDPDFSSIQGLAEAGLIESRLSRRDIQLSADEDNSPFYFSPESPLSRQDLVSWKMTLEKRQLPEADRKMLHRLSGFIDTDKIHPNACPALVADLSSGDQGIIALAFGYTRLFQPDKPVTKAQAALALATGDASDIVSEELARIEAESIAENAVAAHSALVAQVEKDINASFEQELFLEREKINAIERMAEEAKLELETLKAQREEDSVALEKERTAIESEMQVFSKLRNEVQDQLQSLMNNKLEIAYEKERIKKLREQAEVENNDIARLQYELEVERKALSMARTWAEDEAKRVREQAKALEEARDRWEKHGIKVVVDEDLRKEAEATAEVTWLNVGEQNSTQGSIDRAESLLEKLKRMGADVRGKSRETIDKIILMISVFISNLKEWASKTKLQAEELRDAAVSKAGKSANELQHSAVELGFTVKEGAKRVAGDCREGVEKITQKFTHKFKT